MSCYQLTADMPFCEGTYTYIVEINCVNYEIDKLYLLESLLYCLQWSMMYHDDKKTYEIWGFDECELIDIVRLLSQGCVEFNVKSEPRKFNDESH